MYILVALCCLQLAKTTVVNVWKRSPDPQKEMSKITGMGYQAILSAHWYLNRVAYGENWHSYYQVDPQVSQLTAPPTSLLTGNRDWSIIARSLTG